MGITTAQRDEALRADASPIPATLDSVRRCAARADYIELCFVTVEGAWTWCFPEPAEPCAGDSVGDAVVMTAGPYGVQARRLDDGKLGFAMPSAEAMAMILGGCRTYVARKLIERGW